MKLYDDPELDGTDFAHPAWVRGQEYGVRGAAMRIQNILDGKDKGEGVLANDELEKVRQDILKLLRKSN